MTAASNAVFAGDHLVTAMNPLDAGEFVATTTALSAVYVPQTNVFEGQHHQTTDNWITRFWDDGQDTMAILIWEVHDEGDTHPDAATSSISGAGKYSWISVDVAALLLGNNSSDFTPDAFEDIYKEVWLSNPKHAAADEADSSNSTTENVTQNVSEKNDEDVDVSTEDDSGGVVGEIDNGATAEEDPGTAADTNDSSNSGHVLVVVGALLGYYFLGSI